MNRRLYCIVAGSLVIGGLICIGARTGASTDSATYDVVILNGRVMDPESGLDGVRNIGINEDKIATISDQVLTGKRTIDANGWVVAPGFIDLNEHGQEPRNYQFQAHDGVTTSLELEIGTNDVPRWYAERDGKSLINYGVSSGHVPVRVKVMKDPSKWTPSGDAAYRAATKEELSQIVQLVDAGIKQGALAVGMGINYTAAASHEEVLEMFRIAARYAAPVHVHLRFLGSKEPDTGLAALEEVIAAAATTGAPLHVVHVTSMGLRDTPELIATIEAAQKRGMDISKA